MREKIKRRIKRLIAITIIILTLIAISVYNFTLQPQFGKLPSGERLELIKKSPNYKDGKFQNITPTPFLTDAGFFKIIKEMTRRSGGQTIPSDEIPSVKTDLKTININDNLFVWFGHSSYLLQANGVRFLIDPVLSNNASPTSLFGKAFKGTGIYSPDDMPSIDYLLITHDHYDHLDYKTLTSLRDKIDTIICPLGVGAHLEHWGFDKNKIIEKDWDETIPIANQNFLHTVTSRHFSGRKFKRNQSLWTSFVLQTPDFKLFLGCDGGYGSHFVDIGDAFGPFDLAFLENGQYNKLFQYVHAFPEQTIQIAQDLQARQIMPIHSAKFSISSHDWDEPLRRITDLSNSIQLRTLTPKIGEIVYYKDTTQNFTKWWEGIGQKEK